MDFNSLVERKRERFAELEREIADPALFENRKRASEIMREHSAVKAMLAPVVVTLFAATLVGATQGGLVVKVLALVVAMPTLQLLVTRMV
jgi:hypothetical protein